jgi:hypothetical protein
MGIGLGGTWLLTILWAALGYFVYDGLQGVFAILVLSILYDLAAFLALIPFVGVIIQGLVMYFLIAPWVFEFTKINATWLTTLIFWVDIIFGCTTTVTMTFFALVFLKD